MGEERKEGAAAQGPDCLSDHDKSPRGGIKEAGRTGNKGAPTFISPESTKLIYLLENDGGEQTHYQRLHSATAPVKKLLMS